MKNKNCVTPAKRAVLVMAEIKAATDAFDRGDINVFDALDVVVAAVEEYRAAARSDKRRDAA
jgi:hypothetical protein